MNSVFDQIIKDKVCVAPLPPLPHCNRPTYARASNMKELNVFVGSSKEKSKKKYFLTRADN